MNEVPVADNDRLRKKEMYTSRNELKFVVDFFLRFVYYQRINGS